MKLILIFISVISLIQSGHSQSDGHNYNYPKYEVRAVWLTTVNSLDWPRSLDADEQKQSLREIVQKLKKANFNTIYFQVRSRSDAMYKSNYEPWASQLTGVFGKDPGWDPLQLIIEEAHIEGMEVHAWFNANIAWTKKDPPPRTQPLHVYHEHPDWLQPVNGEYWFDIGKPDVRNYLLRISIDLATRYNLDGFQFDFLRYPGKPFPDDATFRTYQNGIKKEDWRRENINKFVKAFHDSLQLVKPMLKIGAAPIGIYKNFPGARGQQSYSELYQDSRKWIQEGWMDYLVPQVYWTLGTTAGDPDFNIVIKDWAVNSSGRQIYVGLGAYKEDVLSEIPQLIDSTRKSGLYGNSFFRYDNIKDDLQVGGKYQYPSLIPPMPWKDSIPPLHPVNVAVQNITDGIFRINWEKSFAAKDGDYPVKYFVYRSSVQPIDMEDPLNIIGILSQVSQSFLDTIKHIASPKYYYGVTSVDKNNNESQLAIESVIIPEIVELSSSLQFSYAVNITYPEKKSSVVFFQYEIKDSVPVILKIVDRNNKEVVTVVDNYQNAGNYIAGTDVSDLENGSYTCLFIAGKYIAKKSFRINQ
ncbi:MAG: family 10 glycosylhydrolase [Ignavibacteriales bacterium]|nr:family 10 glycosylhydrolase [Ignavibacteriales bacterium]